MEAIKRRAENSQLSVLDSVDEEKMASEYIHSLAIIEQATVWRWLVCLTNCRRVRTLRYG